MSRNFELLAQLETELDTKIVRTPPFTTHGVAKVIKPTTSGNLFQDEMMRLIQRVFLVSNESGPRQVVFCGVQGENGSTSVTANAAHTLAASTSKSVCLLDGNLKSPGLADFLGITDTIPLSQESGPRSAGCIRIGNNLWLGGPEVLNDVSSALPNSDKLEKRLAHMRDIFDFVLIDAPGTSVCEDAAILGRLVDAAILVIDANRTRRMTARKAMETLDASGVKVLGTVLRERLFPIPERLYRTL